MEWIKLSQYNLPPQGLKILCFRQGDLWVARRLELKGKSYYLEIPYGGKTSAILTDEPDYWMHLELPEKYTGFIKVGINGGEPLTLDELQRVDKLFHEEFVEMFIKSAGCTK